MKIKVGKFKPEENPLAIINLQRKAAKKGDREKQIKSKRMKQREAEPLPNVELEGFERRDNVVKAMSRQIPTQPQLQHPLSPATLEWHMIVEVMEEITLLLNAINNSMEFMDENLRDSRERCLRIEIERLNVQEAYRKSQTILLFIFGTVVLAFCFVLFKLIAQ